MDHDPTVFIVDDDSAVRRFLCGLIESVDLRAESFETGHEFLKAFSPGQPGCLLLDIRMPGMSGLELQTELGARGIEIPIIFLTAHGDVRNAVRAMKAGAYDFFEKPFNNELLLDAIQKAVEKGIVADRDHTRRAEMLSRTRLLTPREYEVMRLVADGKTNKGAARTLDIAEKTVENHRAKVMEKLAAKSLADLVRMAMEIDRTRGNPSHASGDSRIQFAPLRQ